MPRVSSYFTYKENEREVQGCCAFLRISSGTKGVIVYKKDFLYVSLELYEWWVKFLIELGLEIDSITENTTFGKEIYYFDIEEGDRFFANGAFGFTADTELTLNKPMEGAEYLYLLTFFANGVKNDLQLGEFYILRDGKEIVPTHKIHREIEPSWIITYKCIRDIPQNLLIHTALRYGWHPDCKIVIEKCKEFSEDKRFTPLQILALAHGYLKTTDPDVLIPMPNTHLVNYKKFLSHLKTPGVSVYQCFYSDDIYKSTGLIEKARALRDLFQENKFKEYITLLEQ